ncbi:glucosamine-6-phosphate deaminase [Breznakia pachnodae]|uniref:6-phosphogluconolactonase/glucosamine-6-phosphate isomerase/deaminase n=1 Tax=Breznakia pachnodae TaxID=265178 RepID=A0ABU0E824_9FIRM|nr:glucosamine-6-phosphate deaminase [Breznakia pachnodae]MDQ0362645.1 6-phosphogluconolactonase/glucosamine-6-phosphate isomerase/deaminase [Breznakia pachnodae]
MKLIITSDYEEMSQISAQLVLSKMYSDKRVNLSLTAGSTPARMYEILKDFMADRPYFDNVHFYNFDEISIEGEQYGLTMRSLNEQFYHPCTIKKENIHELNPTNYENYDQKITDDGGLDLILVGIGADGHFCGNLPEYTKFENETYTVMMEEGDKNFKLLHELIGKKPEGATVTFGPRTVLSAKQVVLFANGEHKADIIQKALEGPVTTDVPSSVLKLHPNLVVVLDKEAASKLSK